MPKSVAMFPLLVIPLVLILKLPWPSPFQSLFLLYLQPKTYDIMLKNRVTTFKLQYVNIEALLYRMV